MCRLRDINHGHGNFCDDKFSLIYVYGLQFEELRREIQRELIYERENYNSFAFLLLFSFALRDFVENIIQISFFLNV